MTAMAQHFLLSAKARTLSLKAIYQAGEDAAYKTFCEIRWHETNGKAVCPRCGCCDAYEISTRRRFKCVACAHQYSVTSGTIFASRKMAFVDLLAAICISVNAAKGVSMLQLSRDLDCQYKTAFVLAHKIREALASEVPGATVEGEVEVDGAYFGGHIRPENRKEDRKDRRLSRYQTGKRRVVIAIRQRGGRTLTFVRESEADGVEIVKAVAKADATVYADEARHWDELELAFERTERINHSVAYSEGEGLHTNNVESFFSRLRRMVQGQHHHVSPRYLYLYANEAAWKEDHRRESNGTLANRLLGLALVHPVSRNWAGYWQRQKMESKTAA
jgi:transposase-like protein